MKVMTKVQLPLFEDKNILPTNKYHISFSEFSIHEGCQYRHKLQYIEKLLPFEGSIHTSYGKAIHDCIEQYLLTKKLQSSKEVKKYFYELLKPIYEKASDEEKIKLIKDYKEFSSHIKETIQQIPEYFDTQFPGWKVHSAEFQLFEKIENQPTCYFKGFIDAVLMVPRKEKKSKKNSIRLSTLQNNSEDVQEYDYYILDHKTTQIFWLADKRRDFTTQMQLILYKHYFSRKFNIPLKNIKIGFNLIRMRTPKTRNDRFQYFQISAGDKTIEKSLQKINYMINCMRKGIYMKNRNSCKYCPYYKTEFCK